MERQDIFNKERYLVKDFSFMHDSKEDAIADRTIDLFTYGIVKKTLATTSSFTGSRKLPLEINGEFDITVNAGAGTIDVGSITDSSKLSGLAIDGNGNRIYIPVDHAYQSITTPNTYTPLPVNIVRSSGNLGIPLLVGSANHIWIEYLPVHDTSADSKSKDKDEVQHLTRIRDGYQIILTGGTVPPTSATASIYLGHVTRPSVGPIALPDLSGRSYAKIRAELSEAIVDSVNLAPVSYTDQSIITVQDHVNGLGTGIMSPTNVHKLSVVDVGGLSPLDLEGHRREQHSAGIVTPARSINTTLYPYFSSSKFRIRNLSASEEAYAQGVRLLRADLYAGVTLIGVTGTVSKDTVTDSLSNVFNVNVDVLYNYFEIDFDDSLTPVTTSDYYVFSLTGDSRIIGVGIGGVSVTDVQTYVDTLVKAGKLVIAAVYWNASSKVLTDITKSLATPTDYREFGSIGSKDIEQADGTSGQDVTYGFGIKNSQIQDLAITDKKVAYSVRKDNTQDIMYGGPTTITVQRNDVDASIAFSMDGFYSKWNGGFVRTGTNGVSCFTDGQTLAMPMGSSKLSSAISSALDCGNLKPNNWYAVMAVQDNTTPVGFVLKITTMFRVRSFISSDVAAGTHLDPSVAIDYGWGTAPTASSPYNHSFIMGLTGSYAGSLFEVDRTNMGGAPTGSVFELANSVDISLMQIGDWFMVSPATQGTPMTGLNGQNFRYLGAIYLDGASNIVWFEKSGSRYSRAGYSVPWSSVMNLSNLGVVPPTARAISGNLNMVSSAMHFETSYMEVASTGITLRQTVDTRILTLALRFDWNISHLGFDGWDHTMQQPVFVADVVPAYVPITKAVGGSANSLIIATHGSPGFDRRELKLDGYPGSLYYAGAQCAVPYQMLPLERGPAGLIVYGWATGCTGYFDISEWEE